MKLHKRTLIVQQARVDFIGIVAELEQKYELTFGETLSMFTDYIATQAKYQIRLERHGNTRKSGDEE